MAENVYLVTGATGKTGRRVVELLKAQGLSVREGSRRAAQPFDWHDRSTWTAALQDVTAIYVVLTDLGDPSAVDTLREFADLAAAAGVRKAVMVSFPDSGGMDTDAVSAAEGQFPRAGIALTVLRLRWFSQNFSEDFLLDAVTSGELRLPAGDGQEAFIDADDIAEVAVASLTDDAHAGKSYELAGPQLLTFGEVADEISAAAGREIRYVAVSLDEFVAEQEAVGVPTEWAQILGGLYAHIGTGALASTTSDVEDVLGKPARTFRDYAQQTAASGIWDEQPTR